MGTHVAGLVEAIRAGGAIRAVEAIGAVVAAVAALVAAFAAVGALRDGKDTLRPAWDQVEAAQLPVLTVEHQAPSSPGNCRCKVRNIGNGPALDVTCAWGDPSRTHGHVNAIACGNGVWPLELPAACDFVLCFRSASGRPYKAAGMLKSGVVRQQAQQAVTPPPASEGAGAAK